MSKRYWSYAPTVETFDGEEMWALREVYFGEGGKVEGWTAEPADVVGDSIEDLRLILSQMLRDLDRQQPIEIATCRHCQSQGLASDDHSCPCPNPDATCKDHA